MKRLTVIIGCMALIVINQGWAVNSTAADMAKYFPPGPLVFVSTPNLGELLPKIKSHSLTGLYVGSAAWEKFRDSKLFLKMGDRFEESEKLSGVGINLKNLAEIAGSESALALYNIGELSMVFITTVPAAQVWKSKLGLAKEKFEERRKGDTAYYVVADEKGAAFAFAIVAGRLLVSNNLKLFEQSLGLMTGEKLPDLAGWDKFKEAAPGEMEQADMTIVLDQETLNQDLYFKTYWIHGNAARLSWIRTATLNLKLEKKYIAEQRRFTIAPDMDGAPGNMQSADLVRWTKNAMWLDAGPENSPAGAASEIALWAIGDGRAGQDEYVKELAGYMEQAGPVAIARLAEPMVEGKGFWISERRLVAVKFSDIKSLKIKELRNAIAKRISSGIGAGGLVNASFESRNGVERLDLPLMDGVSPAIAVSGSMLIVSNDAALVREFMSAPAAQGYNGKDLRFIRIDNTRCAEHLTKLYTLLGGRSNWQYYDSEEFFRTEMPSLLKTVAGVKTTTVSGRRDGDVYIEEARYEL